MLQLPQAKCWSEKPTAKLNIPTNTTIRVAVCSYVFVCVIRHRYANSCRMLVGYWKRFTRRVDMHIGQPTASSQQARRGHAVASTHFTCKTAYFCFSLPHADEHLPIFQSVFANGRQCLWNFVITRVKNTLNPPLKFVKKTAYIFIREILFNNGTIKLQY